MFLYDPRRATVLGEYGGIGLVVEGNTWVNDKKKLGLCKVQYIGRSNERIH